MNPNPIHTRFAPTPSGLLHQGNALNAVLSWLWARQSGGSLRLRIDDLDRPRVRDAYLVNVLDTLRGLGLDWDYGPNSMDEVAHHSQIQRLPSYRGTLAALVKTGRVYACTCSRKQIRKAQLEAQSKAPNDAQSQAEAKTQAEVDLGLPASRPLAYPGTCRDRNLPLDTPDSAWRLNLEGLPEESWIDGFLGPVSFSPSGEGDPVIRRRDGGMPAYHIASLTDDVDFGTNGIMRGADLLGATVLQRAIARLLGMDAFLKAHLAHHPLLLAPDGEKMSKSAGNALATGPSGGQSSGASEEGTNRVASRTEEAASQPQVSGSGKTGFQPAVVFQQAADRLNLGWSAKGHGFGQSCAAADAAQSLLRAAQAIGAKGKRPSLLPHASSST